MEVPPLRCWKCDYDLTEIDPEGECPTCGENIDLGNHPSENPILAHTALATGLLSMLLALSVVLMSGLRLSLGLLFVSVALAVLTELIAQLSLPRGARPKNSLASLGRAFALMALIWLAFDLLFTYLSTPF